MSMTRILSVFSAVVLALAAARGEAATRPPSDDGPLSSVRVTTAWVETTLDREGCLRRANTVLAGAGYFLDSHKPSVYGLKRGVTAIIRCDLPGAAFFVVSWRVRPDPESQKKTLDELVEAFERTG